LGLALIFLGRPLGAEVQKRIGIDVVLVIDASKSMQTTDPQNLRKVGAKEFIDLAEVGDRIGIVAFAGQPMDLAPLTTIQDDSTRQALKAKVDQIPSDRSDTHIGAAIARAYQVLAAHPDPRHNQYVLFLTDGKIDVEGQSEAAIKQQLFQQTIPRFQQRQWPIYTVGLSRQADVSLLRELVHRTRKVQGKKVKGLHESTSTARQIPPVYARIMANMVDWVTIDDDRTPNEFLLDPAVDQRAIITVDKRSGQSPTLTLPDGRQLSSGNAGRTPGVRWSETPDYAIVHLDKPQQGRYRFGLGPQDSLQAFAQSSLWLRLYPLKRQVEEREAVLCLASLMRDNTPVAGNDPLLAKAEVLVQVTRPDGGVKTLALVDDGLLGDEQEGDGQFTGYFTATEQRGDYTVVARIHGASFNRKSDPQIFTVAYPASVEVKSGPGPYNEGDAIKLYGQLTRRRRWSSGTRFQVRTFPPSKKRQSFPLVDDGTRGDERAGDGTFTNLFDKTSPGGLHTFLIDASGQPERGPEVHVLRAVMVPVGTPGIVISPSEVDLGELSAETPVTKSFTAKSNLNYDETLTVQLRDVSGARPEALALEVQHHGQTVQEIPVPAEGETAFTLTFRTTQSETETGQPVEATASLRFQSQKTRVYIEPDSIPARFKLVPLPPWWRFWLILLAILLALALLAWLLYRLTRPSLQGKLIVTAPDQSEREFRLRNRGFLGLNRSLLIGSSPRCGITLSNDPDIRPEHAKIWREKISGRQRLAVLDLATRRKRFLKHEDEMELGQHLLRYDNFRDK